MRHIRLYNIDITLHNIAACLIALVLSVTMCGCVDEGFDYYGTGEYPEGDTTVKFSLDFYPFTESGVSTRAMGGKTMDTLDDMCLLAYDLKGNLMEGFPMEITAEGNKLKVDSEDRTDQNASGGFTAEAYTRHAEFEASIPYGNYYLYAVANLGVRDKDGRLVTRTIDALTESGSQLNNDIRSRQTFLEHRRIWDEDNQLNNFELLGNFNNRKLDNSPATSEDMNGVRVDISRPGMSVHAWLRRCLSKVTVDFDGSNLRENIKVYVRRATIHDIPKEVSLGMKSAVTDESEMHTYKGEDYRPDGDSKGDDIIFGVGDDHKQWPFVSKGHAKLVIGQSTRDFEAAPESPDFHSESAPSLFLYENMQGETENDKTNKEQHPAADGTVVGADDMKDNMPYGSYIEVEAYYEFNSNGEVSDGKIIYRFMLGKDVRKNFDVERNYHLKLTLALRGNGNDVDWHIEYPHMEKFQYKDPYYVSYLYDHDSTLHFRYTPDEGRTVVKMTAEIVGNEWWPEDESSEFYKAAMETQSCFTEEERNLHDPTNASFTHNKYTDGDLKGKTKYLGNGFLSLRETTKHVITYSDVGVTSVANDHINDAYFYGKSKGNSVDESIREYNIVNPKEDPSNKNNEAYTVERPKGAEKSYRINIPVFTRAKNLVKETGFSGQNVYDGSRRAAYVRVSMHLDDGTIESKVMRVIQVKRIPNPKGIYRKSGNNTNFAVTLMELKDGTSDTFEAFESDGPWMAEVVGEQNFITLNGRQTVSGSTGSKVSFNVIFNKMNRGPKVHNAIIRVRYHNYCCVHLIFVRQGYNPVELFEGGKKWQTRNFIHAGLLADDPRDEGSMFKFGNITDPIDASNNVPWWSYNKLPSSSDFKPASDFGGLYLVDKTADGGWTLRKNEGATEAGKYSWNSIIGDISQTGQDNFASLNVATVEDYRTLMCSPKDREEGKINRMISHGFGVLYADGATGVKTSMKEAYGYSRNGDQSYGMRGVFVYYYNAGDVKDIYNGRNIFFPIGQSGFGHRRSNDRMSGSIADSKDGTLRYATGRTGYMDAENSAKLPLLYDLWHRPGAIYWAQDFKSLLDVTDSNLPSAALDLNYYTLDVNLLPKGNMQKHSQWTGCTDTECIDACFLRSCE